MDTAVIIRDATLDDLSEVSALHVCCWQTAYRGILDQAYLDSLRPEMFAKYHEPRLLSENEDQPFLVATRDSQIVGFTRAGPTRPKSPTGDPLPGEPHKRFSAEIFAIYVSPELIGQGIGWKIWSATLDRLRERGHQSFCVWVLTQNASGRRFYERVGGIAGEESEITLAGTAYRQLLYGWPVARDNGGVS